MSVDFENNMKGNLFQWMRHYRDKVKYPPCSVEPSLCIKCLNVGLKFMRDS
jgi:hypothetical protein